MYRERECTGGDSHTVAFLSLCSVITSSGSYCLQKDLQMAGETGYNSAKNKMQRCGQPSLMAVLRIDRSGLGGQSESSRN